MSTAISVARERVWHALTTPADVIRWDESRVALLDPVDAFPRVGQQLRWRVHVGSVDVTARQTVRAVRHLELLESAVSMGLFSFDETYLLSVEAGEPQRTRVALKLVASNSVPVVGGLVDRFDVRRLSSSLVDARLRSMQKWCEQQSH